MERTEWLTTDKKNETCYAVPEQGQRVLVTNTQHTWKYPLLVVYIAYYSDGKFWIEYPNCGAIGKHDEPVWWMPLPEPYKKGKHEKT